MGKVTMIKPDNDNRTKHAFMRQFQAYQLERTLALKEGPPALLRLVDVARRDTGQSGTVRRFLLALYNGSRFPFDLTRLRGLDKPLFDDCLAVLTMDARAPVQEVHHYLDEGGALFEQWAERTEGLT